jgi:hypothetical protein
MQDKIVILKIANKAFKMWQTQIAFVKKLRTDQIQEFAVII